MPVSQPHITVVIPTVDGREAHLDVCIDAYERTSPASVELIVIRDEPGCGGAWVKGAQEARGDFLHLGADDLEPLDGWWMAAIGMVEQDVFPAAVVFGPSGGLESAGLSDGELLRVAVHGAPVQASGVPFMRRDWWDQAVDEEELAELHYSTDLLVSHWMRQAGYEVRVAAAYSFRHHWAEAGRRHDRLQSDFARYRRVVEMTS